MRNRVKFTIIILLLATLACSILPIPGGQETKPSATAPVPSATQTVSPTEKPSATVPPAISTPIATSTLFFTATPIPPSPTPTITPTPVPLTSYYLQSGTPVGVPNFANPSAGCKWMGLAGQVFDIKGLPVSGFVLQVGGKLNGKDLSLMALTGGAPLVGPGGYLVTLADRPIESDGSLWIQLYDQAGMPKTGKILLTTYSNCERNLILINLVEINTLTPRILIPLVIR